MDENKELILEIEQKNQNINNNNVNPNVMPPTLDVLHDNEDIVIMN